MGAWLVDFSGVDQESPETVPTIGTMAVQADTADEAVEVAVKMATSVHLGQLDHIATGKVKAVQIPGV